MKKIIIFIIILVLITGQLMASASAKLYISLEEIAKLEDYEMVWRTKYIKKAGENTPEIIVRLDLGNKKIYKNEFGFPLDYIINAEKVFISEQTAKAVFNVDLIIEENKLKRTEPVKYEAHAWTDMCGGLIAHAGGTLSNAGIPAGKVQGTNSRPAVIYSYNHGHRVFEIDFNLTTDNKLAAVHNWAGYKGAMSSEEWSEVKIWGAFASMMLEDVLDIMYVNKDMFLVTDTKSFEYTLEETELQFKILVEAAAEKDPELLERIVPQIYNQEMYDIVMNLHEFKSIIYTLYASRDKNAQVVEFVKEHENIKVVTMGPVRGKPEFITALKDAGKLVYYFTVNDRQEILDYKKAGAHGFYTDFVFPADLDK